MTEVEDGKPFSQVVKSAKSMGYTEPGLFTIFSLYKLLNSNCTFALPISINVSLLLINN